METSKKTMIIGASEHSNRYSYIAANRLVAHGHPIVPFYDYLLSLKPNRVIFNPGTENDELEELLQQHGIQWVEACTLVMLSTGQY